MHLSKNNKTLILLLICLLFIFTVSYAGSGSYNSTYSMTGGVYSRTMDVGANPNFVINVRPTEWPSSSSTMTLFLQQKHWYGWGSAGGSQTSRTVSARYSSTTTLRGLDDDLYRVYMRNYTGLPMRGNVSFNWSW